jgi:hypothetical protein
MGGTSNARVVPWAWCWDIPNKRISAGTIIIPPPTPMRPLNTPATNPKNRYSTISVIRKTPYSLGGSRKTFSTLSRIKLLSPDKDPAEAFDCAGPRRGHMNAFPGVSPRLEDPTTECKVRISMLASES